jgi:Ca-activated chloride channel homolog
VNRRSAIRTLVIAGAGSCVTRLPARTFQDPAENFVIRSEVRLVLLDVSVKNRQGAVVSELSKENFSVVENGQAQPITVFDHSDLPVTVGLLIDESRSMGPKRSDVLAAAQIFIAESNPSDEIFVLNFNDSVKPGLPNRIPFSGDPAQLRLALHRGIAEGKTALNDAVVKGLDHLELGKRDKKTLVLISDGGDNASTSTHKEMIDRVHRSIATIYTVGLFDADDPDRNPGILRDLAKISGGEAYFPASSVEMVPVCHRIAKDIRTRYTIGYLPRMENGRGPLRNIRVHVSAPGRSDLIVHNRASYRYDVLESSNRK